MLEKPFNKKIIIFLWSETLVRSQGLYVFTLGEFSVIERSKLNGKIYLTESTKKHENWKTTLLAWCSLNFIKPLTEAVCFILKGAYMKKRYGHVSCFLELPVLVYLNKEKQSKVMWKIKCIFIGSFIFNPANIFFALYGLFYFSQYVAHFISPK